MTLPRRFRASRLIATAATIAFLATGCGSEDTPEGAAAATSAAPSPTRPTSAVDADRAACHAFSPLAEDPLDSLDPSKMSPVAAAAAQASDAAIRAAGAQIAEALANGRPEPGSDGVIKAMEAAIALGDACGAKYGDGPW